MGIRGAVTQESLNDAEKKRFFLEFINDHKLSWAVGKFSSSDRWALKTYHLEINENGVLEVIDNQFELIVHAYAAPGIDWHTVRMEFARNLSEGIPEWDAFYPSKQFETWLAAQPND